MKPLQKGQSIKVAQFLNLQKHASVSGSEDECKYISSLIGRTGTIEDIDSDAHHPIMVYFSENSMPRRTRFNPGELIAA